MPDTTYFQMQNSDEMEKLTAFCQRHLSPSKPALFSKSEIHRTAIRFLALALHSSGADLDFDLLEVKAREIAQEQP